MNEVTIFKLVSGEEIIGKITSVESGIFYINKPLLVVTDFSDQSGPRFAFMPWGMLTEGDVKKISEDHIIYVAAAKDNAAQNYNAAVGDIVVAPKTLITG